jgi:hypothetical protein
LDTLSEESYKEGILKKKKKREHINGNVKRSVPDPSRDTDPRIRTIELRIRIWILFYSSMAFRMPTKGISFLAVYGTYPMHMYIRLNDNKLKVWWFDAIF